MTRNFLETRQLLIVVFLLGGIQTWHAWTLTFTSEVLLNNSLEPLSISYKHIVFQRSNGVSLRC
jgi:hypothetical protein